MTTPAVFVSDIQPKEILLFTDKDTISCALKKVGDFVVKEDINGSWPVAKPKILDIARKYNANCMVIKTFGYSKRNHLLFIEGSIFYGNPDSLRLSYEQILLNDKCKLHIIRDEGDNPIRRAFTINVSVDGKDLGTIKSKQEIVTDLNNCDNALLKTNSYQEMLDLSVGKSRYYYVTQVTTGGSAAHSVYMGIVGARFQPIDDIDQARLWALNLKK